MEQKQSVLQSVWDTKDRRSFRAMCISYTKDLIVEHKVEMKDLEVVAERMFKFIW